MSWPITFAGLPVPQQLEIFDTMFAAVAAVSAIPCNATGVNVITLTPMTNAPTLSQYGSLQLFSFIAPGNPTGPVRASFAPLPALNVYDFDGMTQAGPGSIVGGRPYMLMFSQLLNGGVGGFYLLNFASTKVVTPGIMDFYAGSPTVDPPGWYVCDGRAVSRTTDAALFSVLGVWYGAGDGSTTFNIPNPQGYFIRVLDDGFGIDPGRILGTTQADQIQDHTHAFSTGVNGPVGGAGSAVNAGAAGGNTGVPNSGNHGTETRPKNMAFPMIIKR